MEDGASGITFDEYDKLVKEDLNGFSPYDYPYSEDYNKRSFLLSCIDTKSAIEGDKIDFGTDQFRQAAEYAKENFQFSISIPGGEVNAVMQRSVIILILCMPAIRMTDIMSSSEHLP